MYNLEEYSLEVILFYAPCQPILKYRIRMNGLMNLIFKSTNDKHCPACLPACLSVAYAYICVSIYAYLLLSEQCDHCDVYFHQSQMTNEDMPLSFESCGSL